MPAGKDFTLCRTGRGLAASRHPFGDARFPVRHSAARTDVPPCNQATKLNNEVSTLSGDLTCSNGVSPSPHHTQTICNAEPPDIRRQALALSAL